MHSPVRVVRSPLIGWVSGHVPQPPARSLTQPRSSPPIAGLQPDAYLGGEALVGRGHLGDVAHAGFQDDMGDAEVA